VGVPKRRRQTAGSRVGLELSRASRDGVLLRLGPELNAQLVLKWGSSKGMVWFAEESQRLRQALRLALVALFRDVDSRPGHEAGERARDGNHWRMHRVCRVAIPSCGV
jgi:hypothetical protein